MTPGRPAQPRQGPTREPERGPRDRRRRRAQVHAFVEQRDRESGERIASATIGQPDESRPQEGGGAKIGRRIGKIAQKRDDVLDLISVEKAETLVDIAADAARLERAFELLMPVAGAKQDPEVARPRLPGDTSLAIPNRSVLEETGDLGGDRLRARVSIGRGDEPERRTPRSR